MLLRRVLRAASAAGFWQKRQDVHACVHAYAIILRRECDGYGSKVHTDFRHPASWGRGSGREGRPYPG